MDLKAQTFTLEGVAASLLLLLATYTIFQSTVVMSPAWSEFENVQLKQLGYDILRVLDNPEGGSASLKDMVESLQDNNGDSYWEADSEFSNNLSKILSSIGAIGKLEVICVNTTNNEIKKLEIEGFSKDPTPNAVRVSRFVVIDITPENFPCSGAKVVEVRLTLWR
ncbi:MAG: hypothetical protein QXU31_07715 [Archaeoglobaceae archaeon]